MGELLDKIRQKVPYMFIVKCVWGGVLLTGFGLLIGEILNEDHDVGTIAACVILGLQFVITMSLVIWNKQDMGVTIAEVSQYDEDRVVYVRRFYVQWKC